jgi:hypothetical protein
VVIGSGAWRRGWNEAGKKSSTVDVNRRQTPPWHEHAVQRTTGVEHVVQPVQAHRVAGVSERRADRAAREDPAEHHALAIGGGRRQPVRGRFRSAGERLDVDYLGAEVLERGAGFEVALLGLVR